tara:strand:+ start:1069 stop:1608 length:540 start_codon:yes stop_codon:yes gene_type:complete
MYLYDLTTEMLDLFDQAVDQETGEIDMELFDHYQSINISFDVKIENTLIYIKHRQMQIEAKQAEIKRLQASVKTDDNVIKNLTNNIATAMLRTGQKKWESKSGVHKCRLSFDKESGQAKRRLDLVPSQLPDEYKKEVEQKPRLTADTELIREALERGAHVEGAQLRLSLTIPRAKISKD